MKLADQLSKFTITKNGSTQSAILREISKRKLKTKIRSKVKVK